MRLGLPLILLLAACNNSSGLKFMDLPQFDAANFQGSPVDNPLYPLVVGRTFTYEADTPDGLETNTVEVTSDTKVIQGVTCVVVHDQVFLEGDLVEDTIDWFAQDVDGNVWYMGEDSKVYDMGVVVSTAGSWEGGVDGATPGIIMWGMIPDAGLTYKQEFYAGEAEDLATILSTGEMVDVPWGMFAGCLRTGEFTPLEPGDYEEKYYAPGLGFVLGVDQDGIRTELVDVQDP